MRTVRAISIYVLAVVLLGALFAPWLYWLVQWLAATFSWAEWMGRYPFKRIFNRSLMLVALAGLWPLLRHSGVRSWEAIGYAGTRSWRSQLVTGFGLGILSLGLAVGVSLWLGHREFKQLLPVIDLTGLILKLLLTGCAVALVEETFFRGGLQQALERGIGWLGALVIVSAIYSVLHFLRPKGVGIEPQDVTAWSGYLLLGLTLTQSFARDGVGIGLVSLFLAGGVLGWAYYRTRLLYLSIGLHTGWVLANELVRKLKAGKITEDWVTWPCLLLLWVTLDWVIRRQGDRWIRQ